jgi:hypothetical protein
VIVRLYENPAEDVEALCEQFDIPVAVGGGLLGELERRGLIAAESGVRVVTPSGEEAAERLIEERRAMLAGQTA